LQLLLLLLQLLYCLPLFFTPPHSACPCRSCSCNSHLLHWAAQDDEYLAREPSWPM
jgi:hypothetical protein